MSITIYQNIQGVGNTISQAKQDLYTNLTEAGVLPIVASKICKKSYQIYQDDAGIITLKPLGKSFK